MRQKQYVRGIFSGASSRTILLLSSFFILLNLVGCDDDDSPPPNHVKVFITSLSYDGNFAGAPVSFDPAIEGADDACNTAATNAGLTGTWTAWLSDNNTDAIDRIFDGGVKYQLINGTVIANNRTDLTDGTLTAGINIDESGNEVLPAFPVWTATAIDGTNPGVGTCDNWTTNVSTQIGRIGIANKTDATWTDEGGGNTCDSFNRLYCFADTVTPD